MPDLTIIPQNEAAAASNNETVIPPAQTGTIAAEEKRIEHISDAFSAPPQAAIDRPQTTAQPRQESSYQDLRVGEKDELLGVTVKEILGINQSYIVYIDQTLALQWYFNTDLPVKDYAEVFGRAGELETRIEHMKSNPKRQETALSALRLIGQGLLAFLTTKDGAAANAALDTADKFITQRSRETSRLWFFAPFLGYFCLSCLAILVLRLVDPKFALFGSLVCAFAGGIGAFISGVMRNQDIPISATAGRYLHWLEATLRWSIGLVAGFSVWLLVTGDLAASFLNKSIGGTNMNALIAITVLAGASERLLPSLIRSFDQSLVKQSDDPKTKGDDHPPAAAGLPKTN